MNWARLSGLLAVLGGVVSACGDAASGGLGGDGGSGATGSGATGSGATGSGASGGTLNVGTGGSGAGVGTGGGPNLDAGCATSSGQASLVPPALMLVVDTSGSMGDPAPGGGGSKWAVTRTALGSAVQAMPTTNHLGLFFYPGGGGLFNCIDTNVEVGLAPLDAAQLQRVNQALQAASPSGGTPTHDAFMVGLNTVNAYPAQTNKFVVLLTDGVPTYGLNCVGTGADEISQAAQDAMVTQVGNAAAGGIRTFVVGVPGSEGARDTLSRMASAAGTAQPGCSDAGPNYCHFDMTTQPDLAAALNAALSQIAGQALTCDFPIPPPPSGETLNLDQVNVWYTPSGGTTEQFSKDDTCASGWTYSADFTKIVLCGAECDRVKADPGGKVDVIFGCDTVQ